MKLIHEAEGHIVTVELTNGELYRGVMIDAEDSFNCQLQNVTMTSKEGKTTKLEFVFLRGSKIRFIILPDMLRNSPIFKRFDPKQKKGMGEGGCGGGVLWCVARSCSSSFSSFSSSSCSCVCVRVEIGLGIGRGVVPTVGRGRAKGRGRA